MITKKGKKRLQPEEVIPLPPSAIAQTFPQGGPRTRRYRGKGYVHVFSKIILASDGHGRLPCGDTAWYAVPLVGLPAGQRTPKGSTQSRGQGDDCLRFMDAPQCIHLSVKALE